jgi:hypothetical protein
LKCKKAAKYETENRQNTRRERKRKGERKRGGKERKRKTILNTLRLFQESAPWLLLVTPFVEY